jgi:small subunit ribosomal protein S4e
MVMNHLSRLNIPKSWPVQRKGIKFIRRPNPGAHQLRSSITLSLALTSVLKYARISKEVKKILHEGNLLVNNKVRKDPAFPVGVMDVLTFPKLNQSFRLLYTEKGKFCFFPVSEKEQKNRAVKIANKQLLKGAKVQLNFSDGTNIIVDKDSYKVEDSLMLSLETGKVVDHFSFKNGAKVYLIGGSHVGKLANVVSVNKHIVTIKINEKEYDTARKYAFVVDNLDLGVGQ